MITIPIWLLVLLVVLAIGGIVGVIWLVYYIGLLCMAIGGVRQR